MSALWKVPRETRMPGEFEPQKGAQSAGQLQELSGAAQASTRVFRIALPFPQNSLSASLYGKAFPALAAAVHWYHHLLNVAQKTGSGIAVVHNVVL